MKLISRLCICGCGATFRTTSADIYASRACEELDLQKRSLIKPRFGILRDEGQLTPPALHPPAHMINAAQLALRLGTHASVISKLAKDKIIPFDSSTDTRLFDFLAVVEAIKAFNTLHGKKILTRFFSSR